MMVTHVWLERSRRRALHASALGLMAEAAAMVGRGLLRLAQLNTMLLLASCASEVPLGEGGGPPSLPGDPGLLVSDPLPKPTGSPDRVWVAMPEGTALGGYGATVQSTAGGVLILPVVNGGFDPAQLEAVLGDPITATVKNASGLVVVSLQALAKASAPPVIVRVSPTPRMRDVPLNMTLLVVFSEQVDRATVTDQTVRLFKGGMPVAGDVELDPEGIKVVFLPALALDPNTDYSLEVTTGVKDLSGEPLSQAVQVQFTTGASQAGVLQVVTSTRGSGLDPDGYRVIIDADTAGAQPVGISDTLQVPLSEGPHTVELVDVAANCAASPRGTLAVNVPAGGATTAAFSIDCSGSGLFGLLYVGTSVTGAPLDPDGYRVVLDADTAGGWAIQVRDTVVRNIAAGPHTVALAGVAANCNVSPAAPVPVTVDPMINVFVDFSVTCAVVGPSGTVWLQTTTTGSGTDPDGYWMILDHDTAGAMVLQATDSIALTLGAGSHTVELTGVAMHCAAASPTLAVVDLAANDTAVVQFPIDCASPGPATPALAFVRDGQVYLVNPDGTGLVQVTSTGPGVVNWDPAWSPDGQRLAFSSNRGGGWAIYVMNADGSNVVRRTSGHYDTDPAWSPDGGSILFSTLQAGSSAVAAVPPDGPSSVTVVLDRPGWDGYPAWSPDGRFITFSSDWRAYDILWDLYVMNADGTNVSPLLEGPFFGPPLTLYYESAWSPDGMRIAVVACEAGFYDCYPSEIVVVNQDGSGASAIAQGGGLSAPTWSPDGMRIAYAASGCPDCQPSLYFASADGSGGGLILANGAAPAWRP